MKQHIARAFLVTLVLLSAAGGMLFADDTTVNLESRLVQDFSKPEAQNWFAIGSKFSTGDFPRWGFINGGPMAVIGSDPQAIKDARSLGVAMLFDRQEYNWIDIIPGTKDKPIEIPLPGKVKMLDMWVWSGNFDYYLDAYVRDYKGIVYTIRMGNLNFVGWKNLRINIPDNIPQSEKYLPRREALTLVKFRIWTRPTEAVVVPGLASNASDIEKAVKFYFFDIKVLTDTFISLFDGDTMDNPSVYKDAFTNSVTK
jgi:hypothetical protein